MRNKIKQLLNKEEGFTLVELLAVLVILAIIVAIAVPAIGNVLDGAQGDADDAETALVMDAARLYYVKNPEAEPVTEWELQEAGYLDQRVEDEAEKITEDHQGRTITKDKNGKLTISTISKSEVSDGNPE